MAQKIIRAFGESFSANEIRNVIEGNGYIEFTTTIIELPGPTRNRRMYPLDEMKRAVESPMTQDIINRGAFYGESRHPLDPKDISRWLISPMEAATHKWTKLWFEGNKMMGTCRTFDGAHNLLAKAIKGGELPAFSIRVLGSESVENGYPTLRDIHLVTIDWVQYPGNPTSYVEDSRAFQYKDVPLITSEFFADGRVIPRGESYDILGLSNEETLVELGNGYYAVAESFNREKMDRLSKIRRNAF